MINKSKTYRLVLIFIIYSSSIFAQQNFRYSVVLNPVSTTGPYKILLSPDLLAKSKADLADIRILDQNRKMVPYILQHQSSKTKQYYSVLPFMNHVAISDSSTNFIAENFDRANINQLVLKIRNTSVQRVIHLSGSDDRKEWYAIRENILLGGEQVSEADFFKKPIDIPFSNYRYFKIEILHKNKEPIPVLEMGIYQNQPIKLEYVPLKVTSIVKKNSKNISRVRIRLKDSYAFNLLHINIEGAKYFKRDINIYQLKNKRRELIFTGNINSARIPEIILSGKTNTIDLDIENEDNPPLLIKSVDVYQTQRSLISYLEKDHQYQILFGDSAALAPKYDLKFFEDSLQNILLSIQPQAIKINPLYKPVKTKNDGIPAWLVWVAIALVVTLLIVLTIQMTKEVSKRSASESRQDS